MTPGLWRCFDALHGFDLLLICPQSLPKKNFRGKIVFSLFSPEKQKNPKKGKRYKNLPFLPLYSLMSPLISRKRWCLPLLRASSVHADCLCSWALCSWRSCWILRSFQKGAEFHRFIHLKFTCLFKVTHLLKARNFLIWHQWKYQMFTSRTETPERGTQKQWGEGFHATNGEGNKDCMVRIFLQHRKQKYNSERTLPPLNTAICDVLFLNHTLLCRDLVPSHYHCDIIILSCAWLGA